MADIRINALATTATTPASDDYLALDGTAQGTRKILATNIANNVTDVILGSSGPSVKSTLSARAPRQGLVFDGTNGTTVANVPTFGTADFTVAWSANPTALVTNAGLITASNGNGYILTNSNGTLAGKTFSSTGAATVGITDSWAYVRASGVGTFYKNGIASGSAADATNYTTAWTEIGYSSNFVTYYKGQIGPVFIYNRALSSSEVVALYEAGAPAGSDYNTASNTAINTSAWTNYLGTYTSFTGASATGFTAVKASGDAYASIVPTPVTATGQKFRVTGTLTLNNGKTVIPGMYVDSGGATVSLTAGSFDITLTAGSAGSNRILITTNGDADYTLANLSVTRIGLLLAPDAYQAGGGTSWYDTSGNSATITLPASGVSWNVPTSGKIASALNITSTTDSSSKDTGCLILEGGLGVEKKATFGGGINGTTTNDSAAAGCVGEYVSSTVQSGSAVSLTTGTAANVTSISLTAGDWDVEAAFYFSGSPTGGTYTLSEISTSSATFVYTVGAFFQTPTMPTASANVTHKSTTRISIASTTTVYAVAQGGFTGGSMSAYGRISARRVR